MYAPLSIWMLPNYTGATTVNRSSNKGGAVRVLGCQIVGEEHIRTAM